MKIMNEEQKENHKTIVNMIQWYQVSFDKKYATKSSVTWLWIIVSSVISFVFAYVWSALLKTIFKW
jgi:elongation factor P--beta-lysine ligase